MHIKRIISQSRRDFRAIYKCEHCTFEKEDSGYDDHFSHHNVIPEMVCPNCGHVAGDGYRPLAPKYSASTVV